jgi:hypothetical protein
VYQTPVRFEKFQLASASYTGEDGVFWSGEVSADFPIKREILLLGTYQLRL